MTEDEAKTKWCPFARVVEWDADQGVLSAAFNRYHTALRGDGEQARCIGSACMAYRWERHPKTRRAVYAEAEHTEGARHGYCGLAGKP